MAHVPAVAEEAEPPLVPAEGVGHVGVRSRKQKISYKPIANDLFYAAVR
jgi:hypothetical protein